RCKLLDHDLRLLNRHEGIRVAVDDECWRRFPGHEIHRRNLATDFLAFLFIRNEDEGAPPGIEFLEVEWRLEPGENPPAEGVLPCFSVIQEIGRREETGHGSHAARPAIDYVLGFRI